MANINEYWDMLDKKREQSKRKGTRASGVCLRTERKNPREQGLNPREMFKDFIGFVPSDAGLVLRKLHTLLNGIESYAAVMEQAGEFEPMCLAAGLIQAGKLTDKGRKMLERLNKKYGRSEK